MRRITTALLSTTVWCLIGCSVGWYIGNQGGFKRGVVTMTSFIEELLSIRDSNTFQAKKYTDV